MKVVSRKPKGQRIYKSVNFHYNSTKRKRPFWVEPIDGGLWFNADTLEWIEEPEKLFGLSSSYYAMKHHGLNDAYSLKSVIRLINKWKFPKGTIFRASLPFVGHDFYIKP